jgi:hypothetical protein
MTPNLPALKILPLDKIILHEDHDMQRTLPLIDKLRAQGILRNPPIVMPLTDGSDRCMVLDGANRITSLREMGFLHVVTQVVQPDDRNVTLQTWNHVVWGMGVRRFMKELKTVDTILVKHVNPKKSFYPPDTTPALIRMTNGKTYLAITPPGPFDQVHALHGLVNCYKERASLDRTSQTLVEGFKSIHSDLTALVIFPRFEINTVLMLAGRNCMLPTGITRFTVSPRALHLNYPLHELSSGKPLEYKEAYLQHWVGERVKNKRVRHYAEQTILFDE